MQALRQQICIAFANSAVRKAVRVALAFDPIPMRSVRQAVLRAGLFDLFLSSFYS